MFSGIRQIVLGSPLPTAEEVIHRLNKVQVLSIFSAKVLYHLER